MFHLVSLSVTQARHSCQGWTMTRGLDVLAAVLAAEHRISDLERVLPTYDPYVEISHEAYTAIGHLMYATNNTSRAAYMTHKVM